MNSGMNYNYHPVNPQIAGYVRTVLVLNDHAATGSSDLPLFTNGLPALLCKTVSGRHTISIYGESVPEEQWLIESDTTLIAFFFKPFALATILKLSAQRMKEKPVELNMWNAQKAMALDVQLIHATSTAGKIDILVHFIGTQIQCNRRDCEMIQYVTDRLMQDAASEALVNVMKELNLTERTFQRLFKKYVGTTASEYRRICQFYFAFSQLKGGHFDKQTDIVHDNGYFDQSHYIRSFKEFTNTTPGDYLQFGLKKKK